MNDRWANDEFSTVGLESRRAESLSRVSEDMVGSGYPTDYYRALTRFRCYCYLCFGEYFYRKALNGPG
jgi:hypothetical protein